MEYGALILRKRKLFILKMRVLTRNEIYDILNTGDIVNYEDVLDFRSGGRDDAVNFVIDNIILYIQNTFIPKHLLQQLEDSEKDSMRYIRL